MKSSCMANHRSSLVKLANEGHFLIVKQEKPSTLCKHIIESACTLCTPNDINRTTHQRLYRQEEASHLSCKP